MKYGGCKRTGLHRVVSQNATDATAIKAAVIKMGSGNSGDTGAGVGRIFKCRRRLSVGRFYERSEFLENFAGQFLGHAFDQPCAERGKLAADIDIDVVLQNCR